MGLFRYDQLNFIKDKRFMASIMDNVIETNCMSLRKECQLQKFQQKRPGFQEDSVIYVETSQKVQN